MIGCSFDSIDAFLTKYEHITMVFFIKSWSKWHKSTVFKGLYNFLTKYRHESSYFFLQNRKKKKASYWFCLSIIWYNLVRIDAFTPNIGVLKSNLKKKDIRAEYLLANCRFKTKYAPESSVFFRTWAVFLQDLGMRALTFPWKIRKKGHRIDLNGP